MTKIRTFWTASSGFEFIDFDDIIYMHSEGNYTLIRMKGSNNVLATRLLGDFEELLSTYHFFRVHKSYIINLNYVKKYTRGDGGTVTMIDGSEIDVARRTKEAFLERIKNWFAAYHFISTAYLFSAALHLVACI